MLARYLLLSCVRPSVRPRVRRKSVSKRLDESSWVFAWRLFSTSATPCCKKIWVSLTKFRVLPSGTFSQTPDLYGKSFAFNALSTKLVVVVDGRACWRHLYDNRQVVAVYCKSINCNPLTPLQRFVVNMSYVNLFSTVDKILTDTTRRAVRLR